METAEVPETGVPVSCIARCSGWTLEKRIRIPGAVTKTLSGEVRIA